MPLSNAELPFVPNAMLADYSLPELLPLPGQPAHLDLGTGLGHFIRAMAPRYPQTNWIGLEYNGQILKRAVRRIRQANCQNAILLAVEARPFLLETVPPQSLAHIWLNFPDPWPKKKHAPRRHTQPWMLALLAGRLRVGGELHLATDVPAYFDQMAAGLQAHPEMAEAPNSPWRRASLDAETKYERKWRQRGRPLFYADWRKERPGVPSFPDQWRPAPALRFAHLPRPGLHGDGRHRLKMFAPRHSVPSQAGFVLIDRQTGISTPGVITLADGSVHLNGAWTTWKIALLESLARS